MTKWWFLALALELAILLGALGTLWFLSWLRKKREVAKALSVAAAPRARAFISAKNIRDQIISEHVTDHSEDAKLITRKIQNYQNWRDVNGVWRKANVEFTEEQDAPPDWEGAYDFQAGSRDAKLQIHIGDSTDASNVAMWGVRLADRPSYWINFKAYGASCSSTTLENNKATFVDLWENRDLTIDAGSYIASKTVIYKAPSADYSFELTVKVRGNHNWRVVNGRLEVLDQNGVVWLRSSNANGIDATGKYIHAEMVEGSRKVGNKTWRTVKVTPNAEDMAGATFPVCIDPTVNVTGTAAIDDNYLYKYFGNANYGASTLLGVGHGAADANIIARITIRCATTSIPSGLHTGFRATGYQSSSALSTADTTLDAYIIAAGNTWIEGGSVGGAPVVGDPCWNKRVYNTTTWAGSVGCGTSGTDYDADATPPSCPFAPYVAGAGRAYTFTLDPLWCTDWKGGRANNGMLWRVTDESVDGSYITLRASEHVSNPVAFEIDYTPIKQALLYWRIPF